MRHTTLLYTGIYLDHNRYSIIQDNGDITHLTPIEYRILETLIENEGKTISRNDLIDHAWGVDLMEETLFQSLTNMLSRLRKKLPILKIIIVTERGVGYRFEREAAAGSKYSYTGVHLLRDIDNFFSSSEVIKEARA